VRDVVDADAVCLPRPGAGAEEDVESEPDERGGLAPAADGAAVAPAPLRPRARSASVSSTADAAAFAGTPAACRRSSNSLLEMFCSLAISCTRFLLISSSILRGPTTRPSRAGEASARCSHDARQAQSNCGSGFRHALHNKDRRRDRAAARRGRGRRLRARRGGCRACEVASWVRHPLLALRPGAAARLAGRARDGGARSSRRRARSRRSDAAAL
jgi:hypothetical protein